MAKETINSEGGLRRSIGEMGLDTRTILKHILEMKVGDELSYEALAALIDRGVKPGQKAYSSLCSARRAAEREGIVTEIVPNKGLRRLDDSGIVQSVEATMEHIHRAARRGGRRLTKVADYTSLPNNLKVQHNLKLSVLNVIADASSTKAEKRLLGKIEKTGNFLPLAKTLEELKNI